MTRAPLSLPVGSERATIEPVSRIEILVAGMRDRTADVPKPLAEGHDLPRRAASPVAIRGVDQLPRITDRRTGQSGSTLGEQALAIHLVEGTGDLAPALVERGLKVSDGRINLGLWNGSGSSEPLFALGGGQGVGVGHAQVDAAARAKLQRIPD